MRSWSRLQPVFCSLARPIHWQGFFHHASRHPSTHALAIRTMIMKRRATSPIRPPPLKKQELDHGKQPDEEKYGIVQRQFYPPEMSNERCAQYNDGKIPRPMDMLNKIIADTKSDREKIIVGDAVVHWYKRDLRQTDNRALSLASRKAQSKGVPLICMYILSPQDFDAHLTSRVRVDFELRTLALLKEDLAAKNIPLYVTTIEKRKDVPGHILDKCREWGAKHIFCNIEYEVDELRREAKLVRACLKEGIDFLACHDDVVVPPETLTTGAGKQYSVYSPWFRAWLRHIHANPKMLDAFDKPASNPASAQQTYKTIFESTVPGAPSNKSLSKEDQEKYASLWPAGEQEAQTRLEKFLNNNVKKYKDNRNLPAANATAVLSVHFSTGTLAARNAIRAARDKNTTKNLDGGDQGIQTWISEVAWRDFYKHVLAHWPYVCMNKPFKYEYTNIRWEYDMEKFNAWCEGRTGFPIVDAAMRQVRGMAYMHNRCRMITACFLAKDLLIDWRMGERFFMEHLIDGDFASNNGGWGFSASTGVDPQPYFRIFNPLLQSEKFDPNGDYIRKWIPELEGIKGKAIHDPYGRGASKEAQKAGYPRPIVDHKECRERCLSRYKEGLGRNTANVGGGVHN